ncbi:MAG TPA: DUF3332 domain-containing protein [Fibrobacteria bacterium]|jgi:hypothetical protein|nr:DUF3332 domain-containing protein [Fibrobacteria bacterium]
MKTRMLPALSLGLAALVSAPYLQGCYGGFTATKKIYNWNGTVGDKWVNSIVMVALNIIPVYPLAGAADILILNTVEFWTGSNPLALKEGETETRVVTVEGKDYELTATQNRMEIKPLTEAEGALQLSYDPAQQAWFAESGETRRLVAREAGDVLTVYHADGQREVLTR